MNKRNSPHFLKLFFISLSLFIFSGVLSANENLKSPVGIWKTIDDETKEAKALVEIKESQGVFSGQLIKILKKTGPSDNCTECPGDKKDKPLVGLEILWGLKAKGGEGEYTEGQILDPKNGKTYSAKMTLIEGGKKLKVRGFLGFSLLGRTQIWERSSD